MNLRESPARSPIRKQLVKKIVSYYSQLDDERQTRRSKSPQRQRRRKSPKRNEKPKPQYMIEKNLENYQDTMHRNAKLGRLEDLMNVELEKAYKDNALVHPSKQMIKSVHGYPVFMKETTDRLKYKDL